MPLTASDKGTYAVYLQLSSTKIITIGKRGQFKFPSGAYLYVGSALGSGGLRRRIERHLHGSETSHWHIDYLRNHAEVLGFFYLVNHQNYECQWGQAAAELPGAYIPVPGFGSSDCRQCRAHLIAFSLVNVSGYQNMDHENLFEFIRESFTRTTTHPSEEIKYLLY
jgi:Uri superfamily endonuclease